MWHFYISRFGLQSDRSQPKPKENDRVLPDQFSSCLIDSHLFGHMVV